MAGGRLTIAALNILAKLQEGHELTQRDLAAMTGIKPPGASRILARLIEKGRVERRRRPDAAKPGLKREWWYSIKKGESNGEDQQVRGREETGGPG